jgi:hypothetical protein
MYKGSISCGVLVAQVFQRASFATRLPPCDLTECSISLSVLSAYCCEVHAPAIHDTDCVLLKHHRTLFGMRDFVLGSRLLD